MNNPSPAAPSNRNFSSYSEFYRNSEYAQFEQEHRCGGTFGASLLVAKQDPIDLLDPPIPELVIQCASIASGHDPTVSMDAGFGLRRSSGETGNVCVAPIETAVRYQIEIPHVARCVSLPLAAVASITEEHGLRPDCLDHYAGRFIRNRSAYILMHSLWDKAGSRTGVGSLYFDAMILQLVAALAGLASDEALPEISRDDGRVARAIDYIEAHIGDQMTVGELAAIACLSPGHFARTFKATTGQPVWTYVQKRRCQRAKEQLLTTQLSIAEVAYRCGFASQGHLTGCFKAQFGVTPAAARKSEQRKL